MIETIQHKGVRWLDITNPTEDDYRLLLEDYHFHPLDIEDCRGTTQRPKIDEYDDYFFLILHFPYFDRDNKTIRIREVKLFWGRDYIITVGKAHWVVKKFFDEIQEDLTEGDEDTQRMLATSDQLLYHILNRLMLETNTLVQRVGAEVDLINYDIFNKKARSIIEQISITRRNILDQYQKMFDSIEDFGELIEGLSQTFDSLLTNRTNEIMRVLTYFSTIMLPLTVVTGFFGMNVDFPFTPNTTAFWIILGGLVLLTALIIVYFRRVTGR